MFEKKKKTRKILVHKVKPKIHFLLRAITWIITYAYFNDKAIRVLYDSNNVCEIIF